MDFKKQFDEIKCDLWQHLKETKKPIVLYGMGDGADKIICELEARNIAISGVFASDGFVREKTFHCHKVETFSSAKKRLGDMVVLVSFGTKLPEVLENICSISKECELYAPDVPVFGTGIFDMEYFKQNLLRLEKIYSLLYDETSKKAFVNSIKYRLTGKIEYLFECETDVHESYKNILKPEENCVYVDIGAYNGDTVKEFSCYSGNNIKVHAFEPDARNFRKLAAFAEKCEIKDINLHNTAAWDKKEELTFYSRSGRNSANTTSHIGAKATVINACDVDSIVKRADYIKIDAEGADLQAIMGAKRIIYECTPTMCIAAYHRTEDYFLLPETILDINKNYDIFFRHFRHVPCWDTNFYFRKKAHS